MLIILRVVENDLLGGDDHVLLLPAVAAYVLLEGHGEPPLQGLLRLSILSVSRGLGGSLAGQRRELLLQLLDFYVFAVNLRVELCVRSYFGCTRHVMLIRCNIFVPLLINLVQSYAQDTRNTHRNVDFIQRFNLVRPLGFRNILMLLLDAATGNSFFFTKFRH